jgi:uncharacterized protein involved in exopolysaccharide biosynthesis
MTSRFAPEPVPAGDPARGGVTLAEAAICLARNAPRILLVTVVCTVVGVLAQRYVLPRHYEAQATFVPAPAEGPAYQANPLFALAQLDAQDLNLSGGSAVSAANYRDIFFSNEVMFDTIYDSVSTGSFDGGMKTLLIDILVPQGAGHATTVATKRGHVADPGRIGVDLIETDLTPRESRALRKLERAASFEHNRKTGTMAVRVSAASPRLAASICGRLLGNFRQKIVAMHESRMELNLAFLERQIAAAENHLREAEDELVDFADHNTSGTSASYAMRLARFQRRVEIHLAAYKSLVMQHNALAYEKNRGTRVFAVIENIVVPAGSDYRPARGLVIFAFVFGGLVLAVLWTLAAKCGNRSGRGGT